MISIDVRHLARSHWDSLKHDKSGRIVPLELGVHYALPLVLGVVHFFGWFSLPVDGGDMLAAFAILFGFYFALAFLMFQLRLQSEVWDMDVDVQKDTTITPQVDKLFRASMYAVLVSLVAVVLAATTDIEGPIGPVVDALVIASGAHLVVVTLQFVSQTSSVYAKIVEARRRVRHQGRGIPHA